MIQGKSEVIGDHNFYMKWRGFEPGLPRREAVNYFLSHGKTFTVTSIIVGHDTDYTVSVLLVGARMEM